MIFLQGTSALKNNQTQNQEPGNFISHITSNIRGGSQRVLWSGVGRSFDKNFSGNWKFPERWCCQAWIEVRWKGEVVQTDKFLVLRGMDIQNISGILGSLVIRFVHGKISAVIPFLFFDGANQLGFAKGHRIRWGVRSPRYAGACGLTISPTLAKTPFLDP